MLRLGECPLDSAFDRFLPRELQTVSEQHWTPLSVVLRAAQWIDELGVRTVLDIGSGAGKFCVAGALASEARFIGLEQRESLVWASRELARAFKVESRVGFVHGTLEHTPLPEADAYYLYNPFGENLFGPFGQIDATVELGEARFQQNIADAERLLQRARVGTYLLTYNGFGAAVPPAYRKVRIAEDLPCLLQMWQKSDAKPDA